MPTVVVVGQLRPIDPHWGHAGQDLRDYIFAVGYSTVVVKMESRRVERIGERG